MLVDKATDKKIKEQWTTLAEPVRKVVLDGMHKDAVKSSVTEYGLDAEAEAALSLEVLLYLVGLQDRGALQATLQDHPVLTAAQGAALFSMLDEKLFGPLAIYLDGESVGGIDTKTLSQTIAGDTVKDQRLKQLPEAVYTVIQSDDLGKSFVTMVQKHKLSAEQAKMLAGHIVTVLVGLGTTNDFKVNVTRDSALAPGVLEPLFQDVEKSLFKPVRTAILTALEAKKTENTDQTKQKDPYRAKTNT